MVNDGCTKSIFSHFIYLFFLLDFLVLINTLQFFSFFLMNRKEEVKKNQSNKSLMLNVVGQNTNLESVK